MNASWRRALEAVGPTGASSERMDAIGIPDRLTQQLLVAGLLRIHRRNDIEAYGALAGREAGSVSYYRLTTDGAFAIGIDPAAIEALPGS
jgi:hypothetical protein